MCARYKVEDDFLEYGDQILAAFDLQFTPDLFSTGDFYPTYNVITLRLDASERWKLQPSSWGLLPASWRPSKDATSASDIFKERKRFQRNKINARSETAHTTWPWKFSFKTQRCLMLATSFFEPHVEGGQAQYCLTDRRAFFIPALWSSWNTMTEGIDSVDSCVMLTTEANDLVRTTRSGRLRQPVVLTDPDDCRRYCSTDVTEHAQLSPLFAPCDATSMSVEHLPKKAAAKM
ncbi:MAG: SOS response-associated peptidase family protein [Planctomycetes bacterium]|nr:SOS response-associated peptidase family protein [Planctomycetota bacterium]